MERTQIPVFKMVIIGDGGVGKSTFIRRHVCGSFKAEYRPNQ